MPYYADKGGVWAEVVLQFKHRTRSSRHYSSDFSFLRNLLILDLKTALFKGGLFTDFSSLLCYRTKASSSLDNRWKLKNRASRGKSEHP